MDFMVTPLQKYVDPVPLDAQSVPTPPKRPVAVMVSVTESMHVIKVKPVNKLAVAINAPLKLDGSVTTHQAKKSASVQRAI